MKTSFLFLIAIPFSLFSQVEDQKELPEPFATESVANYSDVVGWKEGETPKAPEGFKVTNRKRKGFSDVHFPEKSIRQE